MRKEQRLTVEEEEETALGAMRYGLQKKAAFRKKLPANTIDEEDESDKSETSLQVYPGLALDGDEASDRASIQHVSVDGDVISESLDDVSSQNKAQDSKVEQVVTDYAEELGELYKRNSKFIQDKPIHVITEHLMNDPKSSQELEVIIGDRLKNMYK